jgi:hypothetical protein
MEINDPLKGYGSLRKYFSDCNYGQERLKQLKLDSVDIHPILVIPAEARLYGKGKLVNTRTHMPSDPYHTKKDVAYAMWIIKRICLLTHKRQPKWKADEKKWFNQFGPNGKFLLGLLFAVIIGMAVLSFFLDNDNDGVPDIIETFISQGLEHL